MKTIVLTFILGAAVVAQTKTGDNKDQHEAIEKLRGAQRDFLLAQQPFKKQLELLAELDAAIKQQLQGLPETQALAAAEKAADAACKKLGDNMTIDVNSLKCVEAKK